MIDCVRENDSVAEVLDERCLVAVKVVEIILVAEEELEPLVLRRVIVLDPVPMIVLEVLPVSLGDFIIVISRVPVREGLTDELSDKHIVTVAEAVETVNVSSWRRVRETVHVLFGGAVTLRVELHMQQATRRNCFSTNGRLVVVFIRSHRREFKSTAAVVHFIDCGNVHDPSVGSGVGHTQPKRYLWYCRVQGAMLNAPQSVLRLCNKDAMLLLFAC